MTITVPRELVDEIRAHAREVHELRPAFESLGRLVVVDDAALAVDYVRLVNASTVPNKCRCGSSWRRLPGFSNVLVHSHPSPHGKPQPSPGDLRWAHMEEHRRTFGVFALADDVLAIFRLYPNLDGFVPVPVTVVG